MAKYPPKTIKCDDGSVMIEWLLAEGDYRFYVSVEENPDESSWGFVSAYGHMECGDLPEEVEKALRQLMNNGS